MSRVPYEQLALNPADHRRLQEQLGLKCIPGAAFSALFVSQLELLRRSGVISIDAIIDAVRALHNVGPPQRTKRPSQFKRSPLKGLWHVHFWDAQFMPENIRLQWKRMREGQDWLEAAIEMAIHGSGESSLTDRLRGEIARVVVEDAFHERSEAEQLTGEWIVFARQERTHYYLTVAFHSESDDAIRARIDRFAPLEFPFLKI
jgi:hypothetical protein